MAKDKPVIVVEPTAVEATAKVATGYKVMVPPDLHTADFSIFSDAKVILWPDASPESRELFRKLAENINEHAAEIKMILPNGQPYGWNIATAVAAGMNWTELASWAKASMIVFEKGTFPCVETSEAADPVPPSARVLWETLGLAMSHNDTPVTNVDNVVRILAGWEDFKQIIWFDEFYGRYFTVWNSPKPREWQDIDDINLTVILQREFGFLRITTETVSAAIRCRGHQCRKNEPKDWLRNLKWDGKHRLDDFFFQYFGALQNGYTAAVGRNFWLGMVARIYQPGCQMDNMVILEGKQGIYKSKALEAIGGKWYMEASEEITSKDFFVALQGKLIIEIADLDSFSRADTNRIKKVITCRTDRFRMPYGRATQDHPRQSVFVGTTNEQHYLRDATGARRFWPITCGHIKLDALKADRDQLFAEAVSRYLANEDWYKMPQEATLSEQEDRRQYDEWENLISTFIQESCKTEISLTEAGAQVGVDKGKLDIVTQRRLGSILRRLGWVSTTVRRGEVVYRIWRIKDAPLPEAESASPDLPLSISPSQLRPSTV